MSIILVAATGAAALAAAAPASAHTELKSTRPADGGTASTSIRSVSATFGEPIQRGTLRVTGPGGGKVSKGTGGRDPRKVTRIKVRLKRSLGAGRYTARWSVRAADGHEQSGTFHFRLR